jgi:Domain of unknown function (DUF4249)
MVLKKQITRIILLLLISLSIASCVSEYPLEDNFLPPEYVIVDAILNYNVKGEPDDYVIRLSESKLLTATSAYQIALKGATVSIIVNNKEIVPMIEKEEGSYYLSKIDIFKIGSTYKLAIQSGENKYESLNETLPDSVGIQSINIDFVEKPTSQRAFDVTVNLQDPPQKRNYYKWSIKQWEKQQYCQYCYGAFRSRNETCNPDLYATPGAILAKNNYCDGDCYDIVYYDPANSISDIFFDGKSLLNKTVEVLPYTFPQGTLIDVRQSSLTPQYFAFLDLLKSQSVNTGGLADTPAAVLIGNVKNISNPNQKVLGYFSITNTVSRRVWYDRKIGASKGLTSLSNINPALPQPLPFGWPVVTCKESKTRTPKKPTGWQN